MTIKFAGMLLAATACTPAFAADDPSNNQNTDPSIIVTASRNPGDPAVVAAARERLSRTPGSVSVVASETFDDRAVIGLYDLLRDVPGVLANKRYGEEARLSIRGSGLDQSFHQRGVLLAQDGVPFADADGFSDFQKIDPLSARFVEVYKGGNALRFGGAQLGGAVNLVTPTGKTAASPFLARAEAGSFETWRVAAQGAGQAGAFDYWGGFNSFHSDGYRQNSGLDQIKGTLNLGYGLGGDDEVRAILYGADIAQQVPGAVSLTTALTDPRFAGTGVIQRRQARDQEVFRGTLQTRLRLGNDVTFEGGIYATQTDLYHPVGIFIIQDTDTQGAFGRFDIASEIGGMRTDLFAGAFYRQGGARQQLYLNFDGVTFGPQIGDAIQQADALDVFAEGRLFVTDRFALVAGGSWGRAGRDYDNLLRGTTAEQTFAWFAPRAGLLFEDGPLQVYANYTRSVEPPHFSALTQTNTAGSVFVPLDPQHAWTLEAGTRGRSGAFVWDVTYYRAAIEGELLSFLPDPAFPATVFNAGDTRHQGVEASLDWRIASGADWGLRLRQTYAWSDFRFVDDRAYGDNRLPVAPEHQYRAGLRLDAGGLFVEPLVDWRVKDVWVDYANTLKAPGYALLGLSAGYEAGPVLLFLDARNLTDRRYAAEFAAVTDARVASTGVFFPGEGRALTGGVRIAL